MTVKKFNKTLHIKLDDPNEDIIYPNNDELFWNDIYIETSDGWVYLHDTSRNKVCMVDSYGFNLFDDLKTGKTVIFHYIDNDPDYEFNEE